MSQGESIITFIGWIATPLCWAWWYRSRFASRPLAPPTAARSILRAAPPVCLAVLFLILRRWAAGDVRDSGTYVAMYLGLGGIWVFLAQTLTIWLGIDARDDVGERAGAPAAVALFGALLAVSLCYGGANIGDGPGWWVVVFSAALSTGALFLLWFLVEAVAGVSEAVTVGCELAAGIRLAGFLVAAGLILGRAVAGNWVSVEATVSDFAKRGWPALALAAIEVSLSRTSRRRPAAVLRDASWGGVLPAALYVAASIGYVVELGRW